MKKYILFFAMACLVAACSNDIATSELTTQKATLNLLLSAAPNVASRAINAQADGKIYDCTVITFDKNGNVSGKGYQTVEGGVDRFNMAVGLSTNKGEKCKVYAVANTNNPTLFDNVTSLTSFLDMYVTIASPEALTAGNINVCAGASSTALTTQGQLMVSDSLPVTITDGVVPFRLTLYSQCAKVNFEINAEMGDAINGFTVTGYRLFKVPLSGYLHQKYDASTVDIRFSAPDGQYGNFPRVDLSGRPTNVQFTYYIQENHQGRRSGATNSKTRIAANAPDNATYLEVYVQKNGRNGTYRYYLGNLLEDVNQSHFDYYNILRGSDYYITININDIDTTDPRYYTEKTLSEAQIGDFICSDGSIIASNKIASSGKTPVAIVFSTETSEIDQAHGWTHGYAMALKNVHSSGTVTGTYTWGLSVDVSGIPNTSSDTWQARSSDMDGYTNTTYLNSSDYPAGYAGRTTYTSQVAPPANTSGWFLPSTGQWYNILVNLGGMDTTPENAWGWSNASSTAVSNLNTKLSAVGSDNYDVFSNSNEYYWSSSEYSSSTAYYAAFRQDNLYFADIIDPKSYSYRVRPIIAF